MTSRPSKVNEVGGRYGTPLHVAARLGKIRVMQLLLESGESINLRHGNRTPLFLAAENGQDAAVQPLLEKGAMVDPEFLSCDTTALTVAAAIHL